MTDTARNDGPTDWRDIVLHVAPTVTVIIAGELVNAFVFGGVYDIAWSMLALLFWARREIKQHGWDWGKRQSHKEWMWPTFAAWLTEIAMARVVLLIV